MVVENRSILVAGHVSYDHFIYTTKSHHEDDPDRTRFTLQPGDAGLVAQLLGAASGPCQAKVFSPELLPPEARFASSIVELASHKSNVQTTSTYHVKSCRFLTGSPLWHQPATEMSLHKGSNTLVVIGSSNMNAEHAPMLEFLKRVNPSYTVHLMSRPLATGPVWDSIRNGPLVSDGTIDPDRLAVILDADDLREEGIALSKGLSWEATAEDFVRNLGSNGQLDTLVTCPNLFVRFGTQGVIHHRGREAIDPKLYFDPRQIEDQDSEHDCNQMVRFQYCESSSNTDQAQIGLASAFTAGFAMGFAESDLPNNDKGLKYGVAVANRLAETGFILGADDDAHSVTYPCSQITQNLSPCKGYVSVSIPSARISTGDQWSIFASVTGDPAEVARKIVTLGPDRALGTCPIQSFGQLRAVERTEQEGLRAVVKAVQERLKNDHVRPTSIGLVGPPGAGKKFTARNLASHIYDNRPVEQLHYDVRLMREEQLIAACHDIRDAMACKRHTVVFFENFEAVLESGNQLSKSFMAIMREGRFADAGHVRVIGSPLMFFLINREESILRTAGPMSPVPLRQASTDFGIGRMSIDDTLPVLDDLHGLIHVAGPNPRAGAQDAQDKMFTVRRALMLRQLIKEKHPHMVVGDTIKVDEAVLRALLLVPTYKHGLRSMEKIITTSRLFGQKKFDISALPPQDQINLHVDGKTFANHLRAQKLPPVLREKIAEGLFEVYRKRRREMATNEQEAKEIEADRSMRDWDELAPELKESTRAQADDISRKLRAVNCFMLEEERGDPLVQVTKFPADQLEMMAEMEHERFMAERLQRQWRMGPRDSKQRTTPFLIPWRELDPVWKDVDRVMVECVPRVLGTAGWKIYRMKEEDEDEQEVWTVLNHNISKPSP